MIASILLISFGSGGEEEVSEIQSDDTEETI